MYFFNLIPPSLLSTYLGLMELKFLPMAKCFRCTFLATSGTSVFTSPSKSAHTKPMIKMHCTPGATTVQSSHGVTGWLNW